MNHLVFLAGIGYQELLLLLLFPLLIAIPVVIVVLIVRNKKKIPYTAWSNRGYTQKLLELKSLMDQGVLTQEEFETAKKKILAAE